MKILARTPLIMMLQGNKFYKSLSINGKIFWKQHLIENPFCEEYKFWL
jgi:hypothetical protein